MALRTVTLALTEALHCIDAEPVDMDGLRFFINEASIALQAIKPESGQAAHLSEVIKQAALQRHSAAVSKFEHGIQA